MPNDDFQIDDVTAQPTSISVYGMLGTFSLPGSPLKIVYASTFVSPKRADGHKMLLKQLQPMRERIESSDLTDLQSLLQRDLNDTRVAQELIPYLQGNSEIGFFPAILAVLLPKGYLHASATPPDYPKPAPNADGFTSYGDCWSYKKYTISNEESPLGLLKLNPDRSEIIVLDGQHRATAFRYVSKEFIPKDIYQTFYENVPQGEVPAADLPITLIWFESDAPIAPALISRRLFVDVNNNAKPVSESRTILLNDRTVTAVGTQELYSDCAKRGFSANRFSLLQGAFDLDDDISKAKFCRFALTAPPLIESCLRWAMFGSTTYDNLDRWRVERLRLQQALFRFEQMFPDLREHIDVQSDDDGSKDVLLKNADAVRLFRSAFSQVYLPVLRTFFDDWEVMKTHYSAAERTKVWATEEEGATYQEVWQKVFCGGEGLYYSIANASDGKRTKNYRRVIDQIEEKLSTHRHLEFKATSDITTKQVDSFYVTVRTKALQVGFVMAVDYIAKVFTEGQRIVAAERLVERLNTHSLPEWLVILGELRHQVVAGSGTDPKMWPTFRNLFLRVFDGDNGEIYSGLNIEESPEWKALSSQAEILAKNVIETDEQMPETKAIKKHCKALIENCTEVITRAGLVSEWFTPQLLLPKLEQRFREQCEYELS